MFCIFSLIDHRFSVGLLLAYILLDVLLEVLWRGGSYITVTLGPLPLHRRTPPSTYVIGLLWLSEGDYIFMMVSTGWFFYYFSLPFFCFLLVLLRLLIFVSFLRISVTFDYYYPIFFFPSCCSANTACIIISSLPRRLLSTLASRTFFSLFCSFASLLRLVHVSHSP
ncbi:hypothetical protein BJ508DRAFT_155940 [Ascobolus immersus RN42]|uniref:Uncharacterized protein n=1 Tax=Ascobolus immersus RN42 TaxID=1160509 RepID=A0A3N4HZC9_ASCIM|nr:hypothetical protein BJ508DRAFT_155940 [Ascobolus immersus RN42]